MNDLIFDIMTFSLDRISEKDWDKFLSYCFCRKGIECDRYVDMELDKLVIKTHERVFEITKWHNGDLSYKCSLYSNEAKKAQYDYYVDGALYQSCIFIRRLNNEK